MNLVPDIPPRLFTISAIAVAFLLIDEATAKEQNALGNWFMLVGQTLCTNASHQQVAEERILGVPININRSNNPNNSGNSRQQNQAHNAKEQPNETIAMMQKMMASMQKEIDTLKKDFHL